MKEDFYRAFFLLVISLGNCLAKPAKVEVTFKVGEWF